MVTLDPDTSLTKPILRQIVENARKYKLKENPSKDETQAIAWPHCLQVTEEIEDRIHRQLEYYDTAILSRSINDIYHHHVLEVKASDRVPEPLIIDGSYAQFASEADTPITIAPIDEIGHISVVPKSTYIFIDQPQIEGL